MAEQLPTTYKVYQGNTDVVPVRITNKTTGAEIDVSGATDAVYGLFQPGDDPDAPEQVVEKTLADGISISTSLVSITLLPEDTAELEPGTYIHELQLTLAGGAVKTVLQSQMTILPAYLS
jgi:hypothetical protein